MNGVNATGEARGAFPRMARRLRIGIVASGRFHVLDLARELDARGHDVAFYSWVPPTRTMRFGLPARCNRWLLPQVAAEWAVWRASHETRRADWAIRRLTEAYDRAVARTVERCDVLVAMSGIGGLALDAARRRFGAKAWVERGSRHILSQRAILAAVPGAEPVPGWAVERELADYRRADMVSVLARHCEDSFREYGHPADRLVRAMPGVDLCMFPPTPAPPANPPTVVMVGSWSLRKGCDVLTAAWRRLPGVRLRHVGPVGDCPMPTDLRFEHVPTVDQSRLVAEYARGQVLALASREEGLATVQAQGLACGLRLVCTDRTGGADLREAIADPTAVRVVSADDPVALAEALKESLDNARGDTGSRDRLGTGREWLSWAAYAERYETNLLDHL